MTLSVWAAVDYSWLLHVVFRNVLYIIMCSVSLLVSVPRHCGSLSLDTLHSLSKRDKPDWRVNRALKVLKGFDEQCMWGVSLSVFRWREKVNRHFCGCVWATWDIEKLVVTDSMSSQLFRTAQINICVLGLCGLAPSLVSHHRSFFTIGSIKGVKKKKQNNATVLACVTNHVYLYYVG